jgi:hypothetical protein
MGIWWQKRNAEFYIYCNWSHPDVFLLNYLRYITVKTQLIYCQLYMWRHVSTHRVIIRPYGSIIGLMMTL